MDSDITAVIATARTDAVTYFGTAGTTAATGFNTLAAGRTYTGIREQMFAALKQTVSALLTRLNATYVSWKGYEMATPTVPDNFDTYATSGWSTDRDTVNAATTLTAITTIRDKICATGAHWPALVAAMQTFTTPRLTMLQNMYTWATQPIPTSGTNISANALGTHVATAGLGVVAPPLLFTQPIVATTTVAGVRTFYGIVVNNGLAVSSTLLTTLGFETTFVNDSTSVTTTTEHRLTTTVASGNFDSTINLSSLSIPVGTTVTLKTFGSNTANQKVYGNAITFVY
jgi:hypothetical protein